MKISTARKFFMVAAAGLALGACALNEKPQLRAVAPAPQDGAAATPGAGASSYGAAAYQVASAAPVIQSDGTVIPIPRARPRLAENALGRAAAADAAPAAPLAGPAGLAEKAAGYRAFKAAIADLTRRKYRAPRDVRAALTALRPFDPEVIAEGWIADSAFLAASQPEFAKAVRAAAAREGNRSVLSRLRSGTGVWTFDGVQAARKAVVSHAKADYRQLTQLGERFLATALEFQRTRWGAYQPPAPFSVAPRLAADEAAGTTLAGFMNEVIGVTPAQAAGPVMQRILALAGHIAIESEKAEGSLKLTHNRDLARCARFARLNLAQCLAAAHFPSEEAYCTGKHAINEIASCWASYIPAVAR